MTTLNERLAQLKAEAVQLRDKALNSPDTFTEHDAQKADAVVREFSNVQERIQKMDETSRAFASLAHLDGDDADLLSPGHESERIRSGELGNLAFASAAGGDTFAKNVRKAFDAAAPMIGGPSVRKSLIDAGSITAGFNGEIWSQPSPARTLLGALRHEEVSGAKGQYLAQTIRSNNAATVPISERKPISAYGLEARDWEIATIAHVSEPIPKQYLDDYRGLSDFITNQLAQGLFAAHTDFILNGGTAESGNTVPGILTASGVGQTAFIDDPARSIRRAITELERTGAMPSHIIINPDDWEILELGLSQANWAIGGTPLDRVTQKLWSLPVIVEPGMPAGQAIVGNLATIGSFYRPTVSISWTSTGAGDVSKTSTPEWRDMFRRNEARFLSEIRVSVTVASPPSLRVVDLTAA